MNIKQLRSLTGLNQRQFASEYGIPVRTLQSWESNERKCPDYVLNLLSRAINADIIEKNLPNKKQKYNISTSNDENTCEPQDTTNSICQECMQKEINTTKKRIYKFYLNFCTHRPDEESKKKYCYDIMVLREHLKKIKEGLDVKHQIELPDDGDMIYLDDLYVKYGKKQYFLSGELSTFADLKYWVTDISEPMLTQLKNTLNAYR